MDLRHLVRSAACFALVTLVMVSPYVDYRQLTDASYEGDSRLLIWTLASISSLAVHAAIIFTLGGMHVFYDGFIWKLRRPVVAQSLGI